VGVASYPRRGRVPAPAAGASQVSGVMDCGRRPDVSSKEPPPGLGEEDSPSSCSGAVPSFGSAPAI